MWILIDDNRINSHEIINYYPLDNDYVRFILVDSVVKTKSFETTKDREEYLIKLDRMLGVKNPDSIKIPECVKSVE